MSLFRSEVFQARKNRWTGQIVLARPFSLSFLTLCAAAFALILVLFAAFGSYTAKTTVQGQLLPLGGVVRVYAPDAGIITAKSVEDGAFVQAGEEIFSLSTSREDGGGSVQARLVADAELKKALIEQEIVRQKHIHADERAALENTVHRLQGQIAQIRRQAAAQQKRVELAEKLLVQQRILAKEGAVSEFEKTSYENNLLELRNDLAAYKRDIEATARELGVQQGSLNSLPARQQTEISQRERSAAAYNQEILDYRARGSQSIRAPVSGYAAAVNADIGQRADTSRLLAGIVPKDARLQADLYVPSRAIGFVRAGDKVVLRYQAYPYQKFGHAQGRVTFVARTALGRQELAGLGNVFGEAAQLNEPVYLVRVQPEKQTVRAYGKELPLQAGMVLEADILHENRKIYEWVLEPLYSVVGKIGG